MINDSKNPHDSTDCYKVKQEFSLKKLEYRYHNITAILSSPRALKRYQESLYMVCVCGTQGLFDRKRKPQICRTIFFKCKQQTKSKFGKLRICGSVCGSAHHWRCCNGNLSGFLLLGGSQQFWDGLTCILTFWAICWLFWACGKFLLLPILQWKLLCFLSLGGEGERGSGGIKWPPEAKEF